MLQDLKPDNVLYATKASGKIVWSQEAMAASSHPPRMTLMVGREKPIKMFTLPKFNSEFCPEKLPGPHMGSRIV